MRIDLGCTREHDGASWGPFGFRHLWAMRVHGFNPERHCLACLRGTRLPQVHPAMRYGATASYYLGEDEPPPVEFLYVCGVAIRRDGANNFHLAVRPKLGAVATAVTYMGARFTVHNAESLPIPALADGFRGKGPRYTQCRCYQFGVAYVEPREDEWERAAVATVVSARLPAHFVPMRHCTR